jgi:hypothetical protein
MDTGTGARTTALEVDLAHLGIQVTPRNVVQVSAVLRAEAEYLSDKVMRAQHNAVVGEPGADPVSPRAAEGFNRKITNLLDQCQAYCEALRAAADRLGATAKAYGHTEDDLARALASIQPGYAEPTPPPPAPGPHSPTGSLLGAYLPQAAPAIPPPGDLRPTAAAPAPPPDDGWTPLAPPPGSAR